MFASNTSAANGAANYIEDVFSTYLYTGNGSTQTITNGIDLSTKGGLVWIKDRSAANSNVLFDTARGANKRLISNLTNAQSTETDAVTSFNNNGFSIGASAVLNTSSNNLASWTFRKQPKFFDVVTYTGNGTARQINHSLNAAPGCIIVKRTDSSANWQVWHKDVDAAGFGAMYLNTTAAAPSGNYVFRGASFQTSTQFGVDADSTVNASGGTYVAYLFAHNAGGFGLTGTDNVISCGSWTGTGSAQDVTLGYEPQFLIIKNATTGATNWVMLDNMRGLPVGTGDAYLKPNLSDAEVATSDFVDPTATGFRTILSTMNTSGNTYIYIAIRRGPMKVPTSGTSVFSPNAVNNAANTQNTTNFPIDLQLSKWRSGVLRTYWLDRLRGLSSRPSSQSIVTGPYLESNSTAAEVTGDDLGYLYDNTSWQTGSNLASASMAYWNFQRAPSFFDEVCYTGTGSARTISHNLGVAPELMITKQRSGTSQWNVYQANLGASAFVQFTTAAVTTGDSTRWNNTAPTSSVFSLGTSNSLNSSGQTYVWYGFASCPGVSKVGSYTGNGSSQTINCGFTAGVRFLMIKNTTLGGTDWQVWDTARGITSGNDPVLYLNSTSAEVNANFITNASTGFTLNDGDSQYNASGSTYIYLAIA